MKTNRLASMMAAVLMPLTLSTPVLAQTQGVTKNEIVLGTILDLSGPIAYTGKQALNGLQMRTDEINSSGGINGRKIKLLVEDSGYDPKRSVLAAQKLVEGEKVFAIVAHIGTANNIAAMPIQFDRNVINFMPLSGARAMFDPPERLKVAMVQPYYAQIELGVRYLVKQKPNTKVCIIYQDDEYGLEHVRGTEAALKSIGSSLTERASYKRGATDFSSQVAKMKGAGCEVIALGTLVRETISILAESRKNDYNPAYISAESVYTTTILDLGGKTVEGLYGVQAMPIQTADDPSKRVRDWVADYKRRFNEEPQQMALYGYYAMDIFAAAAAKTGSNLTTDALLNVMETTTFPRSLFGNPEYSITKANRLGVGQSRISQVKDGKWVAVTEYMPTHK